MQSPLFLTRECPWGTFVWNLADRARLPDLLGLGRTVLSDANSREAT
jgi:hypothetical protein